MSPLIECEGLACGYRGRTVLQDVAFSLARGEVVVLLGPNGSGKSTLLKTISKLLPALGGGIRVGGENLSAIGYRELALLLSFVPQDEQPVFPFTVRQMVLMGRIAHTRSLGDGEEDRSIAAQAMADADCASFSDRPVTELSGGERQRVLIARALASQAPALLLDEPTAHLDVAHVVGLTKLLRRLAGAGHGVLAAVHDLNAASRMGDRALLLCGGVISCTGTMEAVLQSKELDAAYGIEFERESDRRGRIRVEAVP